VPWTNVLGLCCSPSHPVTDKGIENFSESGESGFELFSNVHLLMRGIESDRGHDGESNGHDVPTMP
jgi:hypothetical protein